MIPKACFPLARLIAPARCGRSPCPSLSTGFSPAFLLACGPAQQLCLPVRHHDLLCCSWSSVDQPERGCSKKSAVYLSCKKSRDFLQKQTFFRRQRKKTNPTVVFLLYQHNLIETHCFDEVCVFPCWFMVSYDYKVETIKANQSPLIS